MLFCSKYNSLSVWEIGGTWPSQWRQIEKFCFDETPPMGVTTAANSERFAVIISQSRLAMTVLGILNRAISIKVCSIKADLNFKIF